MRLRSASLAVLLSALAVQQGRADTLTPYTDRAVFTAAVGPVTVEDFTSSYHFPITTGVLNSSTNLVVGVGTPIQPGDIQPGVTYSSPYTGNYSFNIDGGGGFTGGFLDGSNALTVTFDGPVSAFGFDTNLVGSAAPVLTVNFSDSTSANALLVVASFDMSFFGFKSGSQDITSVVIAGVPSGYQFAIDNFTFSPVADAAAATPLPGAAVAGFTLLGGLGGFRALGRRRRPFPA